MYPNRCKLSIRSVQRSFALPAPAPASRISISKDGFRAEAKVLARNLADAAEVHAGKPQLDLSKASAVESILSRRESMIVARHEVPGKASLKRTVP